MNTKILAVVAFLVGISIGANWKTVKKYMLPSQKKVKSARA